MKAVNIPVRFPIPWGNSAGGSYIRNIPTASQIGSHDGWASLTDGWVPLNMIPVNAGGVPPFGQDANGILKWITQWSQWQGAAGPVPYDATFSTSIGGYPKGAILAATTLGQFWLNLADDNASNPDTGGSNWAAFTPCNLFGTDTGAANAGAITLAPSPGSLAALTGYPLRVVKVSSPNSGAYTLNVNSLGAIAVRHADGTALSAGELPSGGIFTVIYDGTVFQLQSIASAGGITAAQLQTQAGNYALDTGTANALVITLSTAPLNLASLAGVPIRITKGAAANTAGVTLAANGFAATPILRGDGAALSAGELPAGTTFSVIYDGVDFILQSSALHNVNLSGVPTAATATPGTNTVQLATCEFVETALGGIHRSAGAAYAGDTNYVLVHNLGADPRDVECRLTMVCTINDWSFTVGQVLHWNSSVQPDNGNGMLTIFTEPDGNTTTFRLKSHLNVADSGMVNRTLTNGKWQVYVDVWCRGKA